MYGIRPHKPLTPEEAEERRRILSEPRYDLDKKQWDKQCPCIRAMQLDPECPWHGRRDE